MTRNIITLTDEAAGYITGVIAAAKDEGKDYAGLYVGLKKGGCSGHEYDFSYAETASPGAETVVDKGVTLFVDRAAVLYVFGSELDYAEDDFSAKLVFRNPNETGACGCGKSVSFS